MTNFFGAIEPVEAFISEFDKSYDSLLFTNSARVGGSFYEVNRHVIWKLEKWNLS